MIRGKSGIFLKAVIFLLLAGLVSTPLYGAEEENFSATLTDYDGEVAIQKPGEEEWLSVEKDMPLEERDRIKTGPFSFAEILIDDGSLVTIEQNSEITISELSADFETKKIKSSIFIAVGRLISNITAFMHRESRFSVHTPTLVAGVRGTEFVVETTDSEETDVGVFEGQVTVGGIDSEGKLIEGSEVLVPAGRQTTVQKFKRPLPPFAHKKNMMLHKERVLLLRKKAIERRRDLPKIIDRRPKVHKETLIKWNRQKQEIKKIKQERIKREKNKKRIQRKKPRPPRRR